ncbi:MAG: putative entry exclusion protein TrbK-alt [bacterium]|nr:putative entry exclusion protein TrbK-alt [bacterium]
MSRYLTPRHFARIAAVGFIVLIAAWAVIRSQHGEDPGIIAPLEREEVDSLASELARCRTVTLDATASLQNCRRVWSENRRQFFRSSKTTPSPAGPIPTAATASGKIEDRVSPIEADQLQREVR